MLTLISRADWSDKSRVVLSNDTLWSSKSGSIKERTRKSIEIRTGCQWNAYWLTTDHLSARGLCSQSRICFLWQGRAERGCAVIRQPANGSNSEIMSSKNDDDNDDDDDEVGGGLPWAADRTAAELKHGR